MFYILLQSVQISASKSCKKTAEIKQCYDHVVFCKNIICLISDKHKGSLPLCFTFLSCVIACPHTDGEQSETAGDAMRAEMRSNFNDPCGQIASFVAGAEEKTQHPWFVTKDAQIKVFVFWVSLAGRRQDECPQDEEVI